MYELPTSAIIDGKEYAITNNGDYRMVLDCFSALEDYELDDNQRVVCALQIFYSDINSVEDISEKFNTNVPDAVRFMFEFFNCGQKEIGMATKYKLIDWDADEQIIVSAINNVAHKEIRAEQYIHWWTFMGYYLSIGESLLSTIVEIRHKIVTGEKLEKHEKKFRKDNPHYFNWNRNTAEANKFEQEILELWHTNSE